MHCIFLELNNNFVKTFTPRLDVQSQTEVLDLQLPNIHGLSNEILHNSVIQEISELPKAKFKYFQFYLMKTLSNQKCFEVKNCIISHLKDLVV